MINWETFHSRDGNEMIVNMETAQINSRYHTTRNTDKKKEEEKKKWILGVTMATMLTISGLLIWVIVPLIELK